MPVVYRKNTERGWLLLWKIEETEQELTRFVSSGDTTEVMGFGSPERRRQRLAWRAALRSELPRVCVAYEEDGAPGLCPGGRVTEGGSGFIGVSHTKGMAVVIYDPESPCAVDVERLDRRFGRISSRYVSDRERMLASADDRLFEAVCWCAKETLYKYARREGASLLEDIRLLQYERLGDRGRLLGKVPEGGEVPLAFLTFENTVIVYTDSVFFAEKSIKDLIF